ncbi:MAG: hypothetical protein WBF58_07450 [Xanthobacteraceae bacterium]
MNRKLISAAVTTCSKVGPNTDLEPRSDAAMALGATKPFPFEANSFDYVFSKHMIEHIGYAEGLQCLIHIRDE